MGSIKRFTYCIPNITQGGEPCVNPQITWIPIQGVNINCDTDNCITVEFPSGYTGKPCIRVIITCSNCNWCEPIIKDICFCDDHLHCGACQHCSPTGVCIDDCPDKPCDPASNTCVDCVDSDDCKCNQICNAGSCECPATKPYKGADGCCKECESDDECKRKYGNCFKCVGGTCVQKTCEGGVCNPETGECQGCIDPSQCKENEECVDGECRCANGYVYNPVTKKCEPKPDCTTNTDCKTCEVCVSGKCVPRVCPDGYVCVNDECVEECDCDDPSSCNARGNVCRNRNGVCFCEPCGGLCPNCGNGCYCDTATQTCIADPCGNTPCTNGTECGEGCGCVGGFCKRCEALSCTTGECAQALGCECAGDNTCQSTPNPCSGSCTTSFDCGEECGCYKGQCYPCEFFSCDNEDCSEIDGCACNGGKCGDDGSDCEDTLEIVKDDANCIIQGVLTKDSCCHCSPITVRPAITSVTIITGATVTLSDGRTAKLADTYNINLQSEIFKGLNITDRVDSLTNPNIATSLLDAAISGSVRYELTTTYSTGSPSVVNVSSSIIALGITGAAALSYREAGRPLAANDLRTVSKVELVIRSNDFKFIAGQCVYPNDIIGTFGLSNSPSVALLKEGAVYSDDCRDPFFTWFKSANGVFTDSFRRVYVAGVGSTYTDTLSGTENESCMDYLLRTDCSCKPTTNKRIVFCNPGDFTVTWLNDCHTMGTVVIPATCTANSTKQFSFYVNGTKTSDGDFLLSTSSTKTINVSDPNGITSLELRMNCDTQGECRISKSYEASPVSVDVTSSCNSNNNPVYTFTSGSTITKVTIYQGNTDTVVATLLTNPFTFTGTIGVSYTYIAELSNGCKTTKGSLEQQSCCDFFPVVGCVNGQVSVTGIPSGAVVKEGSTTLTPNGSGAYILATSVSARQLTVTINGCTDKIVTINANECSCDISVNASLVGTNIVVAITEGGSFNIVIPALSVNDVGVSGSSSYSYPVGIVTGTIPVTITKIGGCTRTINVVVGSCNLGTSVSKQACSIIGSTTNMPASCACPSLSLSGVITNVTDGGTSWNVSYSTGILGSVANPTYNIVIPVSSILVKVNGVDSATHNIISLGSTFTGVLSIPKSLTGIAIKFVLDNLAFEDNCTYESVGGVNLTINTNGTFTSNAPESLSSSTSRDVEYIWRENGSIKKIQYLPIGQTPPTIGLSDTIIPSATYSFNPTCNCSVSASTDGCMDFTVSNTTYTNCRQNISFSVNTCYRNTAIAVRVNSLATITGTTDASGILIVSNYSLGVIAGSSITINVAPGNTISGSCIKSLSVPYSQVSITAGGGSCSGNTFSVSFTPSSGVTITNIVGGGGSYLAPNSLVGIPSGTSGIAVVSYSIDGVPCGTTNVAFSAVTCDACSLYGIATQVSTCYACGSGSCYDVTFISSDGGTVTSLVPNINTVGTIVQPDTITGIPSGSNPSVEVNFIVNGDSCSKVIGYFYICPPLTAEIYLCPCSGSGSPQYSIPHSTFFGNGDPLPGVGTSIKITDIGSYSCYFVCTGGSPGLPIPNSFITNYGEGCVNCLSGCINPCGLLSGITCTCGGTCPPFSGCTLSGGLCLCD
jgi:hypothetical protein